MTPSPRLRPSLSISLPSFDFPSHNAQLPPKTPEPLEESLSSDIQPPPRPPRETYPTYKVRRKRRNVSHGETLDIPSSDIDIVIPTIETSEVASELSSPVLQSAPGADGLLSPLPTLPRFFTPPKTPAAQVNPSLHQLESPIQEWALINETRDKKPAFERSASVCSSFSDSSISSQGSSGFSIPYGGSCTSPESVATDPFMDDERYDKPTLPSVGPSSPRAKRVKRSREVKWTPEMDQHLEATYVRYLQDPRVTPFKTLPGVAPPLGVCSRVANKARRTWPQYRSVTPTPLDTIYEAGAMAREGSPDTIRPDTFGFAMMPTKQQPPWPRSDSATRRRLRHIVKHKPALSAYYQRLLHTRSVSPFTGTEASRSSEPLQPQPPTMSNASFSSRDLTISLVTSTAPSMQPQGPLAQLASEEMTDHAEPSNRPQSLRASRPAEWFARIGRSQAHQKSQSLQSQLSITPDLQPAAPLASPFDEVSSRSHLLHSMTTTRSLGRKEFQEMRKSGLDSPFEGASTAPRSLKRRFKSDEEKPRRPVLEDVFGPPSEDAGTVRSRGFSVGAVRATDTLTKLFQPPTIATPLPSSDYEMTEAPPVPELPFGCRSAPRRLADPIPRLGSPFTELPNPVQLPQSNTFPRRFLATTGNPQPFQDRLRELAARAGMPQQ